LAVVALADAGVPPDHPALVRAGEWLLDQEVTVAGDWAMRRPDLPPGGWAFEFANVNYPDVDDTIEIDIREEDIKMDVFRASGAGGQHVNKTDSAVRATHLPTGIVVECQDDRSQHKNRARALAILAARIKAKQLSEQQAKMAATRKSLVGSGDRSERIRTYNFPQGRVTDHRINLTLYKIDRIMDGELDELISALAAEHQAEQLAQLAEDTQPA